MTQETEDVVAGAAAIVDIWMGGGATWRTRLDDSDFLESADWQNALELARAVIGASALSDRINVLTRALELIETGECVTDWADQPHEQMQDEARAALHQEGIEP